MRQTTYLVTAAALVAVAIITGASLCAADLKLPDPSPATPTAAGLVEQALRSELAGDGDQRAVLLKQALELDPNYAPARWQSGYVKVDGSWLSLDEAAQRAAADPQLAAYRKRRDALVDTADNQRELARWCAKHKFTDEARIHWAKVLEFDREDAEALTALGTEFYQGKLLAKPQLIEAKRHATERAEAFRHWQPKLTKWRRAIEKGSHSDRQTALKSLRDFNAPNALDAVEVAFAADSDSGRGPELNKLLVETVGRFSSPEATEILIRRALLPNSEKVRASACDELKKRPLYAYVPQLIAAMPTNSSWAVESSVQLLPNGSVTLQSALRRQIGESIFECTLDASAHVQFLSFDMRIYEPRPLAALYDLMPAINRQLEFAEKSQAIDNERQFLKERAQFALERTTGLRSVEDTKMWNQIWNDYRESYVTPRVEGPSQIRTAHYTMTSFREYRSSCFPAGTLVMTATGMRPVEMLAAGDKVLSQDVTSGELQYKPVLTTTLRPAAPTIRVSVNGELLRATRGHPFWVVGRGWRMTKELQVGDFLATAKGPAIVESIDEQPAQEAYNLVVSDFRNYFVGKNLLLVHDNGDPVEATGVPGLAVSAKR
jgi:hypothetical protein